MIRSDLDFRFQHKYKDLGFSQIEPIYETESKKDVDYVEDALIKFAQKKYGKKKVQNDTGGGGGPDGKGSPKIVYVAYKS